MPVLYYALIVTVFAVIFLRKARFHFERIPKLPYVSGLEDPEAEAWRVTGAENAELARVFLPAAARYMDEEKIDRLRVILRHEPRTLPRKLVEPYAMALAYCGAGSGAAPFADVVVERAAGGRREGLARAEHMGVTRSRAPYLRSYLLSSPLAGTFAAVAGLTLAAWLPLLVLLTASGLYRQAALFGILPTVLLFPWYRSAVALAAPLAIYLVALELQRQPE